MESQKKSSRIASFKIVFLYAVISAVYIYTSDYFLKMTIHDIELITKIQMVKGFFFILLTTAILYFLVKKNIDETSNYYRNIINFQLISDNQLKRSQEEYMDLFNHSPLPMWLFDTETMKFLSVNDAACSAYGYTHEEYAAMTLRDIRPAEDIPLMEQMLAAALKSHSPINASIVRHRKKDGQIIQVKIKTSFVTFEGKRVRLASAVDITAEMEVQQKLMESNSRLQLASEIAGLGYWTNDLITSKIQWSDELYKIFEVDPQTFPLTIESIKKCFHPEDQVYFNPKVINQFEDIPIKESERRIITNSGKLKWIFERLNVTKSPNGKVTKLEGITLDITKRKLHEEEIRQSDERFRLLAKATVEAIIDWDIKNDKVVWGDGFQTMFGYDLSVYDNFLWSSNIHPDDREKVLDDLNKTLEDPSKEFFNAEFRFLKANKEIAYVQHKGVFIRDPNGVATRALGAMIDLTDTLERMRQIETQDNALKDIAWTQSHVVRAPLANLLGFVSLLKDNIETGLSDEKLINHINDAAMKLDNIIRDIVRKTK